MNVEEITFGVEIETTVPRGDPDRRAARTGNAIAQLPGWKADHRPVDPDDAQHPRSRRLRVRLARVQGLRRAAAIARRPRGDSRARGPGQRLVRAPRPRRHRQDGYGTDREAGHAGRELREGDLRLDGNQEAGAGPVVQRVASLRGGRVRHRERPRTTATTSPISPAASPRSSSGPSPRRSMPSSSAGYVSLCVGLVERAMRAKKTTNWTAKTPTETSPIHRGGEGQTAVEPALLPGSAGPRAASRTSTGRCRARGFRR